MVYTAIIGEKDYPRSDIKCFTTKINKYKDPCRNAKIYKTIPHLFMNVEWSIWVDGNIYLKKQTEEYLDLLGDKDIAVFKHPDRSCIYQEAKICNKYILDNPNIIKKQMRRYLSQGYKRKQGLGVCGIIIRRHTDEVKKLNEQWWVEICKGSKRDQLSFPYVYKDKVKYLNLITKLDDNDYFVIKEHKNF